MTATLTQLSKTRLRAQWRGSTAPGPTKRYTQDVQRLRSLTPADFLARTQIEIPSGADATLTPFVLWPAQREALSVIERDRLLVLLKARQLGISWLLCGFVLRQCVTTANQPWLLFSQGQLEANELTRRISFLYHAHQDKALLPTLTTDNTANLEWSNGSRVISLPATRRAGRSFTAAGVILDEWAFMLWGREVLAAVKPTIDAGGKLIILSTADGPGTNYHQFWQAAVAGANGYTPLFLPWNARPDRGTDWRDQKLKEAGADRALVLREYPANDIEAFTHAAGQVYDVWSDGPDDGNVTEAADYQPDAGSVLWAIDDGYEGALDPSTGQYTAKSGPRVFLLIQERSDGRLCVFAESYAVKILQESHIAQVRAMGYPDPEYATVDSAAAELRGRLHAMGISTTGKPSSVAESVKTMRRMLAPDENGWRRVLVHPRCVHLRYEMVAYRNGDNGEPLDMHNHGPDALRYKCWTKQLDSAWLLA